MTIGVERPPPGTRHRKFSPFSAHFSMSPVSREMPSRFGPRISGQSPSATRRGACADMDALIPSASSAGTMHFLSMGHLRD